MQTGGDQVNNELFEAASKKDTKKVEQLIESGIDLNVQDAQGRTAIMIATYNHDTPTVKALLDAGADQHVQDDMQNTPFLYAGAEGYLDILRLTIEAGADPTITNRYGGTALIPAAEHGYIEIVEELLTQTAVDVNHVNNLGWTALMEAVILNDGGKQQQDVIRLLLSHGADSSIADHDGITPLQHAKDKGFDEIVEILETAGR
nr:ankyrin repeat domain-containing protein [Sporosarcina obsidiansis]